MGASYLAEFIRKHKCIPMNASDLLILLLSTLQAELEPHHPTSRRLPSLYLVLNV
jgi:hypothetical protein